MAIREVRKSNDDLLIAEVMTRLTEAERQQIDSIAAQLDRSVSWVVRKIIRNHLNKSDQFTSLYKKSGDTGSYKRN